MTVRVWNVLSREMVAGLNYAYWGFEVRAVAVTSCGNYVLAGCGSKVIISKVPHLLKNPSTYNVTVL